MTGNDIAVPAFRPRPRDLLIALALLTRWPLPDKAFSPKDSRPAAHAAWAYPLAGLAVAVPSATAAWLALAAGLSPSIAALLLLVTGVFLSGAMHEDGLADCADGFWGGWNRERRLEIMKDSQIGTYGVLALITSFGLRWNALTTLIAGEVFFVAILGAAIISRAAMVAVMHALPHARSSGLSRQTGQPPRNAALLAGALGLIAAVTLTPADLLPIILTVLLATFAVALIARAKIRGQTGDVLGATQQVVEIAVLLACVASLP
ncbi:adenosylcobinamide-GDP ribazoletransferase [Marimonas sp. MJW-29]|uniref:Adenosylcobinamide-GDP ribazoletransferase n=1 Tax=Sulfitobacter sediminis TaxID=3234186 RepID=A0ABV3RKJ3_9RHOB